MTQVDVDLEAGSIRAQACVEVVQILPGAGLVVRMADLGTVDRHALPSPSGRATPPSVEPSTEPAEADDEVQDTGAGGFDMPAGSSALSWPVEKLQAEWDNLSLPERIRVARYGNRGARLVAMRGRDRTLLAHLLTNPKISTEEIATLAGSAALDPAALRRIASNREWLRSAEVTRNLICNPKLPLPEVERLLRPLTQDELARLIKSGRLRGSVRQAVQKRLARR